MRTSPKLALLFSCALALAVCACDSGPRSGRGLRLPDGQVEKGQAAFAELGCLKCHDVAGVEMAAQSARAPVIVTLGGAVSRVDTYGQLVTSIVNPSHRITRRYLSDAVADDGVSKMEGENFNERMTVAQLIDLVAFLQSHYELRLDPIYYP